MFKCNGVSRVTSLLASSPLPEYKKINAKRKRKKMTKEFPSLLYEMKKELFSVGLVLRLEPVSS